MSVCLPTVMTTDSEDFESGPPPSVRLGEAQPGIDSGRQTATPTPTLLPARLICRGDIIGRSCLWLSIGPNLAGAGRGGGVAPKEFREAEGVKGCVCC